MGRAKRMDQKRKANKRNFIKFTRIWRIDFEILHHAPRQILKFNPRTAENLHPKITQKSAFAKNPPATNALKLSRARLFIC